MIILFSSSGRCAGSSAPTARMPLTSSARPAGARTSARTLALASPPARSITWSRTNGRKIPTTYSGGAPSSGLGFCRRNVSRSVPTWPDFPACRAVRFVLLLLRKASHAGGILETARQVMVRLCRAGSYSRRIKGGNRHVDPPFSISGRAADCDRSDPRLRGHGSRKEMGRFRIPAFDAVEGTADEGDGVVCEGRRTLQGHGDQRAVGGHPDAP